MKQSFLNQNRPLITGMVLKDNPDEIRYRVKNSIYAGADALGIQLCRLKKDFRSEDNYRNIFNSAEGRPIYITNYRYCENQGMSDDECAEGLVAALGYGATLADIMGDLYDPSPMEFTKSEAAIAKQMRLIDSFHAMGKEVLMSSHIYTYTPAEKVLEIALEHQRRGADIAKIVTGSTTEDELLDNLKTTALLRRELKIPFLFLSGGACSRMHRMVGPQLGCCMYLAVYEHDQNAVPTQPTIAAAKAVRDNM